MLYLWIAFGSALGGVSRFALGSWIVDKYGTSFPWGTLLINIIGSGLIGLFATTVKPAPWRQLLMAGLCGGFTTFSSFSLETLLLLRQGHSTRALAYIALSVLVCLASVWMGHTIGSKFAE
jgi:CrcB protein